MGVLDITLLVAHDFISVFKKPNIIPKLSRKPKNSSIIHIIFLKKTGYKTLTKNMSTWYPKNLRLWPISCYKTFIIYCKNIINILLRYWDISLVIRSPPIIRLLFYLYIPPYLSWLVCFSLMLMKSLSLFNYHIMNPADHIHYLYLSSFKPNLYILLIIPIIFPCKATLI